MARTTTQFCVAILAVGGMVATAVTAVWSAAFEGGSLELAFAAVTGLTGITGPAVAFLFRLNGQTGGN